MFWNNFVSALEDLWFFFCNDLLNCRLNKKNSTNTALSLTAFSDTSQSQDRRSSLENNIDKLENVSQESALSNFLSPVSQQVLSAPVMMYVCKPVGAERFALPAVDFDCLIDVINYGSAVTVIGYMGQYACVNRFSVYGWIKKDDLTPRKSDVWPTYIVNHIYDYNDKETIKARNLLADTFYAGRLNLPLQAGEYILVKLLNENRLPQWSTHRPRIAGSWQKILRGVSNVHIGISPKTDSVMEWIETDGTGRLAYVESVSGDRELLVSTVGLTEEGQYQKRNFSAVQWRELRPVFIEVI